MAEFPLEERLDVARRRLIVIEAVCTSVSAGIGTSDLIWAELDDLLSATGDLAREALDALKGTETMPFKVGQWEPAAEQTPEAGAPAAAGVTSTPARVHVVRRSPGVDPEGAA